MSKLLQLGLILILVGFVLTFIGALTSSKTKTDVAFGSFIGPIPFGFATDPRMFWIMIILLILLALLLKLRF